MFLANKLYYLFMLPIFSLYSLIDGYFRFVRVNVLQLALGNSTVRHTL